MDTAQILAFLGVATLVTITPGADTLLVLRSVLAHGSRAGVVTAVGICCGCLIHACVLQSWSVVACTPLKGVVVEDILSSGDGAHS